MFQVNDKVQCSSNTEPLGVIIEILSNGMYRVRYKYASHPSVETHTNNCLSLVEDLLVKAIRKNIDLYTQNNI